MTSVIFVVLDDSCEYQMHSTPKAFLVGVDMVSRHRLFSVFVIVSTVSSTTCVSFYNIMSVSSYIGSQYGCAGGHFIPKHRFSGNLSISDLYPSQYACITDMSG